MKISEREPVVDHSHIQTSLAVIALLVGIKSFGSYGKRTIIGFITVDWLLTIWILIGGICCLYLSVLLWQEWEVRYIAKHGASDSMFKLARWAYILPVIIMLITFVALGLL